MKTRQIKLLFTCAITLVMCGCGEDKGRDVAEVASSPAPSSSSASTGAQQVSEDSKTENSTAQAPTSVRSTAGVTKIPLQHTYVVPALGEGRPFVVVNDAVQNSGKQVIINAANDRIAYGSSGKSNEAIIQAAGIEHIEQKIKEKEGRFFKDMITGTDDLGGTRPILGHGAGEKSTLSTSAGKLAEKGTQYIIHALGVDFRKAEYKYSKDDAVTKHFGGLGVLRHVYRDVFKEMVVLHAKDATIKSIGLLPLSGFVFRGGVPADQLYEVLAETALDAMRENSWLEASFYMFSKQEFDDMHAYLTRPGGNAIPDIRYVSSPTGGSLSLSMGSMRRTQSGVQRALMEGEFSGLIFQGYTAASGIAHLGSAMVGTQFGQHVAGLEIESSINQQQFAYSALKAKAEFRTAALGSMTIAVGVAHENLSSTMQANMKAFLNQFGVNPRDLTRVSYLLDMAHAYNWQLGDAKLSTLVGVRNIAYSTLEHVPFVGLNATLDGVDFGAFASTRELVFNVKFSS